VSWHARLALDSSRREGATMLRHRQQGPLRVLGSL
jgi:hypothetical protein